MEESYRMQKRSLWHILSERTAKYNQLLRIEEELGDSAVFPGIGFRKPAWMA